MTWLTSLSGLDLRFGWFLRCRPSRRKILKFWLFIILLNFPVLFLRTTIILTQLFTLNHRLWLWAQNLCVAQKRNWTYSITLLHCTSRENDIRWKAARNIQNTSITLPIVYLLTINQRSLLIVYSPSHSQTFIKHFPPKQKNTSIHSTNVHSKNILGTMLPFSRY